MAKHTFPVVHFAASALALAYIYAHRPQLARIRKGQVAIITGGSTGLGLALAHRFGKAGVKLVLAARSEDQLECARRELLDSGSVANEDDILLVSCDVTDREQAAGLIQSALSSFGAVDILINDAGIITVGPVENQPIEAYERSMATNFFGAVYTTHAILPYFLGKKAGTIINIASIGGKYAVPHLLPYVASKYALVGFSEGLHSELKAKGVRVTTVCPGLMRTGGETHANFHGQTEKEKAWFQTSAQTPLLSATSKYAADRIFDAVNVGKSEITITPQAWLLARFAGLMPESSQFINSLINQYILPAAVLPRDNELADATVQQTT